MAGPQAVRFVGLDTVTRGPDYWTAKTMTPKERMGHMVTLDGSVAGAWAGVGRDQFEWLNRTLPNTFRVRTEQGGFLRVALGNTGGQRFEALTRVEVS